MPHFRIPEYVTINNVNDLTDRLSRPTTASVRKTLLWSKERITYERECQEQAVIKDTALYWAKCRRLSKHYPGTRAATKGEELQGIVSRLTKPTVVSTIRHSSNNCSNRLSKTHASNKIVDRNVTSRLRPRTGISFNVHHQVRPKTAPLLNNTDTQVHSDLIIRPGTSAVNKRQSRAVSQCYVSGPNKIDRKGIQNVRRTSIRTPTMPIFADIVKDIGYATSNDNPTCTSQGETGQEKEESSKNQNEIYVNSRSANETDSQLGINENGECVLDSSLHEHGFTCEEKEPSTNEKCESSHESDRDADNNFNDKSNLSGEIVENLDLHRICDVHTIRCDGSESERSSIKSAEDYSSTFESHDTESKLDDSLRDLRDYNEQNKESTNPRDNKSSNRNDSSVSDDSERHDDHTDRNDGIPSGENVETISVNNAVMDVNECDRDSINGNNLNDNIDRASIDSFGSQNSKSNGTCNSSPLLSIENDKNVPKRGYSDSISSDETLCDHESIIDSEDRIITPTDNQSTHTRSIGSQASGVVHHDHNDTTQTTVVSPSLAESTNFIIGERNNIDEKECLSHESLDNKSLQSDHDNLSNEIRYDNTDSKSLQSEIRTDKNEDSNIDIEQESYSDNCDEVLRAVSQANKVKEDFESQTADTSQTDPSTKTHDDDSCKCTNVNGAIQNESQEFETRDIIYKSDQVTNEPTTLDSQLIKEESCSADVGENRTSTPLSDSTEQSDIGPQCKGISITQTNTQEGELPETARYQDVPDLSVRGESRSSKDTDNASERAENLVSKPFSDRSEHHVPSKLEPLFSSQTSLKRKSSLCSQRSRTPSLRNLKRENSLPTISIPKTSTNNMQFHDNNFSVVNEGSVNQTTVIFHATKNNSEASYSLSSDQGEFINQTQGNTKCDSVSGDYENEVIEKDSEIGETDVTISDDKREEFVTSKLPPCDDDSVAMVDFGDGRSSGLSTQEPRTLTDSMSDIFSYQDRPSSVDTCDDVQLTEDLLMPEHRLRIQNSPFYKTTKRGQKDKSRKISIETRPVPVKKHMRSDNYGMLNNSPYNVPLTVKSPRAAHKRHLSSHTPKKKVRTPRTERRTPKTPFENEQYTITPIKGNLTPQRRTHRQNKDSFLAVLLSM